MSKFSNLYDIDGNIINKSPQHTFTLEETEQLVDDLTKKVQENPDNEVYKVYLNNAQKWLYKLYNEMNREDLMKRMNFITDSVKNAKDEANDAEQAKLEAINKVMEELKAEYDKEDNKSDTTETEDTAEVGEPELVGEVEQSMEEPETINTTFAQTDLLVNRDEEAPVMNEYVEFEEAS